MDEWVINIIADPVTKMSKQSKDFKKIENFIDARVFLKNTFGWKTWKAGQKFYEKWLEKGEVSYLNNEPDFEKIKLLEKPVYKNFNLRGNILDIGGGVGTLREFLKPNDKYLCIDPHYNSLKNVPKKKVEAYKCLKNKFNFIIGFAEFLPIRHSIFDFVHMRSMLDHVQVPDLAILEAHRVLKNNGKLIVGLTVEGGKIGKLAFKERIKKNVRETLYFLGLKSLKDYHTWHPSYKNLCMVIEDNGFKIEKIFWQPGMNDKVVYIQANKS
jgi:ubiquinone/menaquinone biosynthesis C-methylase UbiE